MEMLPCPFHVRDVGSQELSAGRPGTSVPGTVTLNVYKGFWPLIFFFLKRVTKRECLLPLGEGHGETQDEVCPGR